MKTRKVTIEYRCPWRSTADLIVEAEVTGEDDPGYFDPWDGGRGPESRAVTIVNLTLVDSGLGLVHLGAPTDADRDDYWWDDMLDRVLRADDDARFPDTDDLDESIDTQTTEA